ncbi:uncharacterized protein [Panulirus ornatus]
MHRASLVALLAAWVLATLTTAVPVGDDPGVADADFVLRNISALWEEVRDLRREVNHHLHHGHTETNHDQILEEVGVLLHEHHVHHDVRPHENHNEHHSKDLLNHMEAVHGHSRYDDGPSQHLDRADDSVEDDGDDNNDHSHEDDLDHEPDAHDRHGLHSLHDDDHHGHDHGHDHAHGGHHHHHHDHHSHDHVHDHDHEHHAHDHDHHAHDHDHDHDHHAHDHDHDHDHHAHDHDHDHDHHAHDHDHDHDHVHDHDHHDHDHESHQLLGHHHHHHHVHDHDGSDDEGDRAARPLLPLRRNLAFAPGREPPSGYQLDPWMYASCLLQPNVDVPESDIRGGIVISQRKDLKGPVFFDMRLSGFDVSQGRVHGFHVHESAVTDGRCGTAGGHFNPRQVTHGGPTSSVRHVGDLGNIEVNEDGELDFILSDKRVALVGENSIIGKSIVIHEGEDDLGLGGDSGSLTTGNAGGRLACCNVYIQPDPHFRFKG